MRYSEINEIAVGGGVDGTYPGDLDKKELSSDQLDLFDDPVEVGVPKLPPGFHMRGRMGEFFVAEEIKEKNGDRYRSFVFIHKSKAVAFMELKRYDINTVQYTYEIHWKPDLTGSGYRTGAVWVDEAYRGKRLGVEMYVWVLTNVCDYLMADDMQTHEGVRLWKNIKRDPRIATMVWDSDKGYSRSRRTGKDFDQVYKNDRLIPWIALKSKVHEVEHGEDE